MQNRNLILSIAIHIVMALAFVIVSPISAKLRAIPEIIVVKTYEMAVVPEPEPEEVVPEKPKPAPVPQEQPVLKERPRAIPDNRTEVILPHEKLRERTVDTKSKREDQSEKGEQRALPAVGSATTPTHEEVGQRDVVDHLAGGADSRCGPPGRRAGSGASPACGPRRSCPPRPRPPR